MDKKATDFVLDAFAVVTAVLKKAKILTGDPELREIEEIAPVEWL
jgi:hypothetical protein